MRKQSCEFQTDFLTEAGTLNVNKDYFAFAELDDFACYVIADGLDSDEDNESAEMVVHHIFEAFMEKPTMSRRKLKSYLMNAHKLLKEASRNVRLKVSLTMLVTDYSKIIWLVAGNSRLYHFRKGIFNFRSKDQSIAQMLLNSRKITEAQINSHEERNNLNNYLGKLNMFKPYISRNYELKDGDVMLLCTAGFWENMFDYEINNAVHSLNEPMELIDNLEEMLLERQNEVVNNYTIAAIFAKKVFPENKLFNTQFKETLKKFAVVVLPMILIGLIVMFVNRKINDVKQRELAKIQAVKKRELAKLSAKKNEEQHEKKGDQLVAEGEFAAALNEYKAAREAAELLKDTAKMDSNKQKYEITKMINDADGYFSSKAYERAMNGYLDAKVKATAFPEYDKKELLKKLAKTRDYIKVIEIAREGENALARKEYTTAQACFREALRIAKSVYFEEMKAELENKLNDTDSRQTEQAKEDHLFKGKLLESRGDELVQQKRFDDAISSYNKAKMVYQELKMSDSILNINTKIKAAQEERDKKFLWIFPNN